MKTRRLIAAFATAITLALSGLAVTGASAGAVNMTSPLLHISAHKASPHATTYSCPDGGVLSGTVCVVTTTSPATPGTTTYSCPSGGTLSGSTCTTAAGSYAATPGTTTYSCPSGGTLSGSTCTTAAGSYAATPGTYSCPASWSLSGTTCTTSGTNFVPASPHTGAPYSCPSGGTLSGTMCDSTTNIGPESATACSDNGGSLSGGDCYVPDDYAATGSTTYTCSSGTLNGTTCYVPYTDSEGATLGPDTCPSGGTLSGSTCTTAAGSYAATGTSGPDTCPSGGTLSGSTCTTAAGTYPATGAVGPDTCPSGAVLSGSTCTGTTTYNATASNGGNPPPPPPLTAYAAAIDGTVFACPSTVSQAAAQATCNGEVAVYNTKNPPAIDVSFAPGSTSRSHTLKAKIAITHAPAGSTGSVRLTLYGPVVAKSSQCRALTMKRYTSSKKSASTTSVKNGTVAPSGSTKTLPIKPTGPLGCYVLGATVTFSGGNAPIGAKPTSSKITGKSSLFRAI